MDHKVRISAATAGIAASLVQICVPCSAAGVPGHAPAIHLQPSRPAPGSMTPDRSSV